MSAPADRRRYRNPTTPLAYTLCQASPKSAGPAKPPKTGRPAPMATGCTFNQNSSTRPSRTNASTVRAPPNTTMSPPASSRRCATSSAIGRDAIREFFMLARVTPVENTTFGVSSIQFANSTSSGGPDRSAARAGHAAAKLSNTTLPDKIVSAVRRRSEVKS